MSISPVGGAFIAFAISFAADPVDTSDSAKIQGRWTAIFYEEAGASLSTDITRQWTFEFKDTSVAHTSPALKLKGSVRLDASKTPKAIDLVWEDGKTVLGIYEFDQDKLKICIGVRGEVRPTKFASNHASGTGMMILERKAP